VFSFFFVFLFFFCPIIGTVRWAAYAGSDGTDSCTAIAYTPVNSGSVVFGGMVEGASAASSYVFAVTGGQNTAVNHPLDGFLSRFAADGTSCRAVLFSSRLI
jgi:hypothetical protein